MTKLDDPPIPNPSDTEAVEWLTGNYGGCYELFVDPVSLYLDFCAHPTPESSLVDRLQEELDATFHHAADPRPGDGGLTYVDGLLKAIALAREATAAESSVVHPSPDRDATETAARVIYEAMRWAAATPSLKEVPLWQEHGNSVAQDKARDAAASVLASAMGDASARKDEECIGLPAGDPDDAATHSPASDTPERIFDGYTLHRIIDQPVGLSDIAEIIHRTIGFDERWDRLGDTVGINRSRESAREVMRVLVREIVTLPYSRNELFKRLCKLGTPINCLIGAARSAEGLDRYHDVRKEWVDGLLDHSEKAREAWDGIVALFDDAQGRRGSDAG